MAAEARAGGLPDPADMAGAADRVGGPADGAESPADSAPGDGPAKKHGDPLAADAAKVENGPRHSAPDELAGEGRPAAEKPAPFAAELAALRTALEERTRDLQRVTAEYANYRKRVDRDRALVVEQATGNVIAVLLPVLDDLDRARDHGDLTGPFAAVADQLTAALAKFGLTPFGAKGDAFDPTRHEAVAHRTSAEVTEPSCVAIMRRGYQLGERLLRPALVEVADPE
jgi:molecular chaperone GrpE